MSELRAEPCVFVVFGATGDLMRRKLLPALFELSERKMSPGQGRILGVARDRTLTDDAFREWAHQALLDAGVSPKKNVARWCRECLGYQAVATGDAEEYKALEARIVAIESAARHRPVQQGHHRNHIERYGNERRHCAPRSTA